MLFFRPTDLENNTDEVHRKLTEFGIPEINFDTNEPLTLDQRLHLLELEIAAAKQNRTDPINLVDKDD